MPGGHGVGAGRAQELGAGAAGHVPGARWPRARRDPRHPRWVLQRAGPSDKNWGSLQGPALPSAQTVDQAVREADPFMETMGALRRPHSWPLIYQPL